MIDQNKTTVAALSFTTFLLLVVWCRGNQWVKVEVDVHYAYLFAESGIWFSCSRREHTTIKTCTGFKEFPDWVKSTRAFSILAVLLSAGGMAMAVLTLITEKVKGNYVSFIFIISGFCGMVSLCIYASEEKNKSIRDIKAIYGIDYSYGWTYILGWMGSILGFITSAVRLTLKCGFYETM